MWNNHCQCETVIYYFAGETWFGGHFRNATGECFCIGGILEVHICLNILQTLRHAE